MLINKNFNSQRVKSSWREILVQNLNTSKVAYSHLLWGFTPQSNVFKEDCNASGKYMYSMLFK